MNRRKIVPQDIIVYIRLVIFFVAIFLVSRICLADDWSFPLLSCVQIGMTILFAFGLDHALSKVRKRV